MNQFTDQVAKGAAWLDANYPGWVDVIDLDSLDISDCTSCVMAQVNDGLIGPDERGQLIAQAVETMPPNLGRHWKMMAAAGELGGFNVLAEGKGMVKSGEVYEMGFALPYLPYQNMPIAYEKAYDELLEAWTCLIIQRRLDAHPDVAGRIDSFLADPSTGVRVQRPMVSA